jgi:putative spermidine/putrescine transport system permease protein
LSRAAGAAAAVGLAHTAADSGTRWAGRLVVAVSLAFLLIPALLTIVMSFSAEPYLLFPPDSWGLRQYRAFFGSPAWLGDVATSLQIAVPTAVISLIVGLPAALALNRTRLRGRGALRFLSLASLIIPVSAYGVALYGVFLDLHLLGRWYGLSLADALLGYPLVVLVLDAAIGRISPDLELAAMSLGASRHRAWVGITLRLLIPAVAAGFFLAFMASMDEAVFVNFLGAGLVETLPKAIFDSVRFGLDPVITAIASLFIAVTGALSVLSSSVLRGRGG